MAGTFSLNTAGIPNLTQVLVALYDGTVYDFQAQKVGSSVTVADPRKQAAIRAVKIGATPVHTEV